MGALNEASENIKRLSAMFKGLVNAADEIDKMGSLENHVLELGYAKTAIVKENEGLELENKQLLESINLNTQKAKQILADAYAQQEELAKATEQMCDDKSAKNKELIDALTFESDVEQKKIEAELKKAKDLLADLNTQIKEEGLKLESLKAEIATIKEKF